MAMLLRQLALEWRLQAGQHCSSSSNPSMARAAARSASLSADAARSSNAFEGTSPAASCSCRAPTVVRSSSIASLMPARVSF